MDDTISRQAAIDAVEESRRLNHHQDGKEACAHEYEHRHFLKILRDLPSVQPEIIRCKDCKYWKPQVKDVSGGGLGCCTFHKANFVTGEGFCYWAERRSDSKVTKD